MRSEVFSYHIMLQWLVSKDSFGPDFKSHTIALMP